MLFHALHEGAGLFIHTWCSGCIVLHFKRCFIISHSIIQWVKTSKGIQSYLIVCAIFKGEVARDGGHGFGQVEAGVCHLVWHNVGAVESEVHFLPPAHVSRCAIQCHFRQYTEYYT